MAIGRDRAGDLRPTRPRAGPQPRRVAAHVLAAGLIAALCGLPRSAPAQTYGGTGGNGTGGAGGAIGGDAGGAGGIGFAGAPGGPGGAPGGGGGGGSTGGGTGGSGGGGAAGGGAGAAGAIGAMDNETGNAVGAGGGGGGGGANGNGTGVAVLNNTAPLMGTTGGAGGAGGAATSTAAGATAMSGAGGGGGAGGAGALVAGSGTSTNTSTITGGTGGAGGNAGNVFAFSFLLGSGGGGGAGGDGAVFLGSVTFDNTGALIGGTGGSPGFGGSSRTPTGMPTPPQGQSGTGGAGGNGLSFAASATFNNDGTVKGGSGGAGVRAVAGFGTGTFIGSVGESGGAGGAAVVFMGAGSTLASVDGITGGAGGGGFTGGHTTYGSTGSTAATGGTGGSGGAGGIGVFFAGENASIVSSSSIVGGTGGNGGAGGNAIGTASATAGTGGAGGAGGAALVFATGGAILDNTGMITGGNGGTGGAGGVPTLAGVNGAPAAAGAPGAGGIGIVADGITIANAGGTIAGGLANGGAGAQAYAILFNGGTNTVGTGGTITGGIDVASGSFQPALPGSAIGTPLAVGGPLVFAQTSTYQIRLSPKANDAAAATGAATPGGAMVFTSIQPGPSPTPGMRYTILTATGGVAGTFDPTVGSNLAFFRPVLSYDSTDVFLTAAYNYVLPGATQNERSVGAGLNNAARIAGTTNPAVLAALNEVPTGAGGAVLDSISGEGIAAAQNTAFGSTALFISSIFDQTTFYGGDGGSANQITLTAPQPGFSAYAPSDGSFTRTPIQSDHIRELADLPSRVAPIPAPIFVPQRTWRAWATGFGGVEDFSGNAFPVGSAGQSDTIYGGTLGIDYQLMPNYLAGLAIGGSNGDFSVAGRGTSGSTTGGHVAFYDLSTFGAFYAASTTSASFYSNQTTRTIAGFGGLGGETDRGNFRSDAYSSKVEFGRHFSAYGGLITPFASIELTELRSYGFTETPLSGPGLFALNVQGQDTASVPSLVGARFQTVLPLGNGLVLLPSLQFAWEHQFSPQRPVLAGLINLPGAVFLTNGASPARDSAAVKAGGELAITRQAALFANFDGDFSGVDRFYGGKGGFKYVW